MSASHENNRFYGDEDRYIGYIGKAVEKALNEGRITRDDADLLAEFVTEVSATQHVSPKRLHKLHYILINWREFIGPFRENNISRLYQGIEALRRYLANP